MSAPWKVGKWPPGEYVDKPWYAHDRGGWFGAGLPGRSFATHAEAITYATKTARYFTDQYEAPDDLENTCPAAGKHKEHAWDLL